MPFKDQCIGAMRKADQDMLYIGVVCRFNKDDSLVVTTRNDEYGKGGTSIASENLKLAAAVIQRIKPVRELIKKEMMPAYVSAEAREVHYWEGQVAGVQQADYSIEALGIYRDKYVRIGLAGPEYMKKAEDEVRAEALKRVQQKLMAAKNKALNKPETDKLALFFAVDDAYARIHGTDAMYPPEYIEAENDGGLPGGHAEENLIRAWSSAVTGLELQFVELFVTRMPCPDKSAGFQMDGRTYKEGCINKLIQLVRANPGVKFEITYYQLLDTQLQTLSQKWANSGFPADRTSFGRTSLT